MEKGSITVFSAMSMMLIASLLFALLESARSYGLHLQANQKSILVTESVFAEYNAKIWEDYHLLFLDGAYGGEEFSIQKVEGAAYELMQDNLSNDCVSWGEDNNNLFPMEVTGATVEAYQLATDEEGKVFFNSVINYMKENFTREAAQKIYERIEEGKNIEKENSNCEEAIERAEESLENSIDEAENEKGLPSNVKTADLGENKIENDINNRFKMNEEEKNDDVSEGNQEKDILEYVLTIKQNAILGMVLDDVSGVSDAAISMEDSLLRRQCEVGTMAEEVEADWYGKILFGEYLASYFSDYTQKLDGRALDYELEYLICGKASDRANLDGVVERLMLAREAGNIAAILMDSSKLAEASALAVLLAGYTANPAIIKAVKIGIISAWAYLESILDIRTLLQGGKIALIKSPSEWTLDTGNIISSFNKSKIARDCEDGLAYQDYLMQFLFVQSKKELSYRTMDLIEKNLHMETGYEHVKMDHMLVKAQISYECSAEPIFWKLIVLEGTNRFSYSFLNTTQFSYQIE